MRFLRSTVGYLRQGREEEAGRYGAELFSFVGGDGAGDAVEEDSMGAQAANFAVDDLGEGVVEEPAQRCFHSGCGQFWE